MSNKVIAGLAVALLLVVGGGLYVFRSSSSEDTGSFSSNSLESTQEPASMTAEKKDSPQLATTNKSAGNYLEYSEQEFSQTTGDRVLFFHADWCPKCRALDRDINSSSIPEGLTIFKVDYDNSDQLKAKYGVTLQTTLVKVDEQGELVSKYVAYDNPTLDKVLSNL